MHKSIAIVLASSLVLLYGCAAEKDRKAAPKNAKAVQKGDSHEAPAPDGEQTYKTPDVPDRSIATRPLTGTPAQTPDSEPDVEPRTPASPKKFSLRKVLTPKDVGPKFEPETSVFTESAPESMPDPVGGSAPIEESDNQAIADTADARIVPVFFGTNRRPRYPPPQEDEAEEYFTSKLGPLQFGICRVSVPRRRDVGSLETATKENRDPAKVFVLRRLEVENNGLKWVAGIADSIANAAPDERDALVFVHGYNVSFADAVYRTAQLKEDLKFAGPCMTFSWPSRATLGGYHDDEIMSEKSVADFEQFLRLILKFSNATKLHVIAHSMGNRVMAPALANIAIQPETNATPIDQVILAAPDIDAQIFRDEIAPRFQKAGVRRTLYASKNDGALRASYLIHKLAPRLGDAINHVRNLAVEAVDAQLTDTSLLAHSYYGDQPLVIADIQAVLSGKSPSERNLVRLYDNSWSFKMAGARDWTWILIGVAFAAGFLIGIGLTRSRKQPA